MGSITASVDAVHGVVWLEVDYASDPSVTSVRIIRVEVATGVEANVRIHSWLSDEGLDCITLVGNTASTYDTEAPMDIPVYYRLEDCAGVAASVNSLEVVVPSGGRFWLKDPLRPYLNVPITLRGDENPCTPVLGVYFRSMSEETFPGAGAVQRAVNRRNAVAVVRVRSGYNSTLNLATRTFVDRDAVRDLLSTGDVLFLQSPASYGIPQVYVHVPGSPAWQRLSSDHKKQWRLVSIPFDEVDRPAGLAFGVSGTRWADMCDLFANFLAFETAGISWRDVMAGLAGNPADSIVTGWRTYAMVKSEFATYAAILPYTTIATDSFSRVVANGWGTATSGQVWTTSGGVAADYLVNGGEASIDSSTVDVARETILPVLAGNVNILLGKIVIAGGVVPTGAAISTSITARRTDVGNYYMAELLYGTNDLTTLRINKLVAGTITTLGSYSLGLSGSGVAYGMRFMVVGSTLRARAWNRSLTEPAVWQLEVVDGSLSPAGDVGVRVVRTLGNTNPGTVSYFYDDLTVNEVDRTYQELLEGD
jgi:hypothetical protein